MSLEAISQNLTQPTPIVSPYFKKIIDDKVAGVALTCFEAIVHWLLTTCSCFYPAYNRFYEHQTRVVPGNPEAAGGGALQSTSPQTSVEPSTGSGDPQTTTQSIETLIPLQQEAPAETSRQPQIPRAQTATANTPPDDLEVQSTSSEEEIEATAPTTSASIGLAALGNMLQELHAKSLFDLVNDLILLPPSPNANALHGLYVETIAVKLPRVEVPRLLKALEELILPSKLPVADLLQGMFQAELVNRLGGDPLCGEEPSRQMAKDKLYTLLAPAFDAMPNGVLLDGWRDRCPRKFQEHSFRSAAALEAIAKRANQGSLQHLMETLDWIQMKYNEAPTLRLWEELAPLINSEHPATKKMPEAKPIRAMQAEVIQRLGGLNPYSVDNALRQEGHQRACELIAEEVVQKFEQAMSSQNV